MKKLIFTLTAAAMLTGCRTQGALSAYDERPENKQPVLERPAWPNYDLHNDRSFAAFSHVQTAPSPHCGTYLKNEDGSLDGSWRVTLYRSKEATYLCYDWDVPTYQDWWFFRCTEGAAIIDADTGDRYLIQYAEHFPMNQCYWIYGQSGETIRFVNVYPPLPPSVKNVQIYTPSAEGRRWMDGTGSLSRPYKVDDLRPQPAGPAPKKTGRIIR